jgi:hypothetical protein
MTEPATRIIIDRWGAYEIPADSVLVTAPRRRDGWWDRRTLAGRAAIEEFTRNEKSRREAIDREGGL